MREHPAQVPANGVGRDEALARFDRLGLGRTLAFCLAPAVLGVGAAIALHLTVVLPSMGAGSNGLTRIVRLGQHLDGLRDQAHSKRRACVVGDSVSVEGIDAALVAAGSGGEWQVENYAINGATREQIRLILPKLLATKPDAVIYVIRAQAITEPVPLAPDLAYAYALGGFAADWPEGWVTADVPGIPVTSLPGLRAERLAAELHFRGALVYRFNDAMHERFSGKTKLPPPDSWSDAHHLTGGIAGDRLTRHLNVMEAEVVETAHMDDPSFPATLERHERDLEELVSAIRAAGSVPVLVSAPLHPRLRESEPFLAVGARLEALAAEWDRSGLAVHLRANTLLEEADFADALHPSGSGRERLSAFIGRSLPALTSR